MKRQRSKLEITQFSSHNECRRISNSNTVEISDDAIVESTSPSSTRVRVRKQSKKISDDQITNFDSLSIDVIMEIFKRLAVKTLARFVSVSKFWASIIRSQDFKKVFLTKSSNRVDRLVFTMKNNDEDYFCFSLQTNDSGKALIATYHVIYLANPYTFNVSSVHDLICFGTELAYALVVYNTSTRRSITLPKFDSQSFVIKHFLGYDPIDGVYKVLCMTRGQKQTRELKLVLQVLTLGNENSWKMIEDVATHTPINQWVCINGVLYYGAYADTGKKMREIVVMSFDVRSEKFGLIKRPEDGSLGYSTILIRYEEKLAIIFGDVSANGDIVLWVLEDAKEHGWLKKVFNCRNSWISLAWARFRPSLHDNYRLVDVNDAGEFILAPIRLSEPPFYVLYYDSKTNSMRKVLILGITEPKRLHWVKRQSYFPRYLFCSQVESLMFL